MSKRKPRLAKRWGIASVCALLAVGAFAAIAVADNVQVTNDVSGTITAQSGGTATASYTIAANNGDGQNGCNASDGTPLTVTVVAPAGSGVTASPASLTFTDCTSTKSVTLSGPPGEYAMAATASDSCSGSGCGTYNVNPARFTLIIPQSGGSQPAADTTPPTINCTPPDNTVWYAADVQVPCTASDASGLQVPGLSSFTLSTNVGPGSETSSASTGSQQVCDTQSNCATAGPYTFMVDRKGPSLAPSVTPNPAVLNGTATASANATDLGSGVFSQSCDPVDTTTIGLSKTVGCTAADNVGNESSANASYSVVYGVFTGFLAPIDNPETGKVNGVKAGSAVPVKFQLADANGASVYDTVGLDILATDLPSGSPSQREIRCDTSEPVSNDTQTVAAGSSSLAYDAASQTYTYVWKTNKTWGGTCRRLTVSLNDGTSHYVDFKVMK